MRVEKTVFISYRHTNQYHALSIYQYLTTNGYDVFFDYKSIGAGSFERIILGEIDARAHFLVILTPSALKKCNEPGDWLRREIEYALERQRNIVPLMLDEFDFKKAKKYLTGNLALLAEYQGIPVSVPYFDAAMTRLREQFLNQPLAAITHPTPPENTIEVERIIEVADNLPAPTEEQLIAEQYFERAFNRFKEDNEGKIADYTESLRHNPNFAEAYNNRGVAHANKRNYQEAIADFDRALNLNSNLAIVYYNRGAAHKNMGDYARAIADYDIALRLNPNHVDAYNNRGNVYKSMGDYARAIADYDIALRLNPNHVDAYYNRGIVGKSNRK